MLDIKEIEQEIAELEHAKNHSPSTCIYLAALYSILDHQIGNAPYIEPATYSQSVAPMQQELGNYGDSDFLVVVAGKLPKDVCCVMDDLMDTLRVTYPRVYDSVMRKIRQL